MTPSGTGRRSPQPSPITPEQEQDAVRLIKEMPLDEYARLRSTLGVRSVTDMSHLFGGSRR